MQRLKNEPHHGLRPTSERLYNLLTLGVSLPETIDSDTKSYTLHYIDWEHSANNLFHVSDEFTIERHHSRETRRPDLVRLVNGILLVVIGCKRPDLDGDKAVEKGISQILRNQREDEIRQFFVFSQLLLAPAPTMRSTPPPPRRTPSGRSGVRRRIRMPRCSG